MIVNLLTMEYYSAACFVSMIDISALVMMVVQETAPVGFPYLNMGCVCKNCFLSMGMQDRFGVKLFSLRLLSEVVLCWFLGARATFLLLNEEMGMKGQFF